MYAMFTATDVTPKCSAYMIRKKLSESIVSAEVGTVPLNHRTTYRGRNYKVCVTVNLDDYSDITVQFGSAVKNRGWFANSSRSVNEAWKGVVTKMCRDCARPGGSQLSGSYLLCANPQDRTLTNLHAGVLHNCSNCLLKRCQITNVVCCTSLTADYCVFSSMIRSQASRLNCTIVGGANSCFLTDVSSSAVSNSVLTVYKKTHNSGLSTMRSLGND